jgi:DNA repair protein RecN (Recombination protein N)
MDLAERERSNDYVLHQLAEIDSIDPKSGEDDELSAERKILTHAERITELGSNAYYNLYESDDSIIARLTTLRRQLEELGGFVGDGGVALDSLLTGIASLTDVAEALRRYGSGLDYSPARLSEIESRLAELEGIKRKYKTDLEGLLKVKDELAERLSESNELVERGDYLRKEAERLRNNYIKAAKRLSDCRRTSAPLLEKKVMEGLRRVAMDQANFLVSVDTVVLEDADSDVDLHSEGEREEDVSSPFFTAAGADTVEFLLSANPGESPRLLSYVASGGELSRLMLALRTAGQEAGMSETVVFDEIDAGIGGQVAEAVGQLLKSLSTSRQVFCVTHQAQIAKYADHHFVVTKLVEKRRTQTTIRELAHEDRISELSRMIGGDEKAEKTRDAAQWLLENARETKAKRTKK